MHSHNLAYLPAASQLVASVLLVDEVGKIVSVMLANSGREVDVVGQLESVSRAQKGDQVVLLSIKEPVVIGKLATSGSFPCAKFDDNRGKVSIKADQSICIKTPKGSIEIYGDGSILLEGDSLSAETKKDLSLQGWPIRLN
ncbi:hypothetical protein L1077_17980 [Pseudoalteromonas luteoviolacea]|uniref:Gp5/Type VI secretion system Vgr protein OB-fold domain-containing protein n=2 Tax=Pseudoalteromonas luteoviolacea TaxID=43657 RepID=A0A167ID77_9GAMM|nr:MULTISPECIES: hypothetical protein [Pseudoalteromonas]KZN44530.1 hypothetical protein N476_05900 [Pseudoalteromonas luteoviolacea H33]KZN59210.1 hypothetical protein N473_03375 [Pseudoalteromonas luteoviolacea CPMOR-1]KZN75332.1 hypothetical protein N477_18910 [Pseudoalteromonas luteoviolacea H33-S]MBQ4879549.1 hypothetical protein [Pseudoalteromonas luteoviolacea]MBQ4908682.1 hypothetical protein [Pseudoalteromonas luteoviolacea]